MSENRRLIDADKLVEVAQQAYNEWNLAMAAADGNREINKVFKQQELCKKVMQLAKFCPTVDAVEVVRCEECRHNDPNRLLNCGYHISPMPKDGYCSAGKKKEG